MTGPRLRRAVAALAAGTLAAVVAPSPSGAVGSQEPPTATPEATPEASAESAADGAPAPLVPMLHWTDCGDGFECATAQVPFDYTRDRRRTFELALVRKPAADSANRIGALFVDPGGPGASAVDFVRTAPPPVFATLSRFDVVGVDHRGYGGSRPTLDCGVDQEALGVLAQPFPKPLTVDPQALAERARAYGRACATRNAELLPHVHSANIARDLDLLRAAIGDEQLSYVGISYGSVIGSMYATLFPGRVRAMVLDAPIDVETWLHAPMEAAREEAAGFEGSLDRFFAACAASTEACSFGGADPEAAFDALVDRLDMEPLASADPADPRPVDGDDVRMAAAGVLYDPSFWSTLAEALTLAEAGDGSLIRALTDDYYARLPDGTYSPTYDYYTAVTALEQDFPTRVQPHVDAGRHAYSLADHFWVNFNAGYSNLVQGLWPVEGRGVFRGPIEHSPASAPIMVVGTQYDPVTPYVWAERLAADLGNARLLTYRGDGHGSLTSLDPCILGPFFAYVIDGVVPPEGVVCDQQFEPFDDVGVRSVAEPEWPRVPFAGLGAG